MGIKTAYAIRPYEIPGLPVALVWTDPGSQKEFKLPLAGKRIQNEIDGERRCEIMISLAFGIFQVVKKVGEPLKG
jgi:hypothetical protein